MEQSKPSEVQLMIDNDKQYADWVQRQKSVNWQNLKQVHTMTTKYLKDYPKSAHAQYISAVMAGDYAELLGTDEEQKIKEGAVDVLFGLMERLGEFRPKMRYALRNEYYYHSNQFLNQYLLGCEELISDDAAAGHFSIGVGGSEHAFQILKTGNIREAKYFAQKAVVGWRSHAEATPDWSYPYPFFYTQALMISGDKSRALQELERVKATPSYQLKKPIYDKYEERLMIVEKLLSSQRNGA